MIEKGGQSSHSPSLSIRLLLYATTVLSYFLANYYCTLFSSLCYVISLAAMQAFAPSFAINSTTKAFTNLPSFSLDSYPI
jgi:hypothetical protein